MNLFRRVCLLLSLLVAGSCTDAGVGPEGAGLLQFATDALDLSSARRGDVVVGNVGLGALGPVELTASAVRDQAGLVMPGSRVVVTPTEIATLNPGDTRVVDVTLALDEGLQPGAYRALVTARAGAAATAEVWVRFLVLSDVEAAATSLVISDPVRDVVSGDVTHFAVEVRGAEGQALSALPVQWAVEPAGAGYVTGDGRFVGYGAGAATLVARVGAAADTAHVTLRPRALAGTFRVVGEGRESLRHTSDLWLFGDVAYTGTWGGRQTPQGFNTGNTLQVWDVSAPDHPLKASSLQVDARTVNDVKVRKDGALAVMTHEGSNDGQNGITLLDLHDPLDPEVVGRFTQELESGVHNVWLDGDYAYLVVDGVGSGLRVLDVSDPSTPRIVSRYYAGESFLHDVYVRDGLAFLSHWNAGLVILDVGHGVAGGSPENPVEVSRLRELGGQTHNAWYWPEAGYVFVGEEDFDTPGVMRVVDVADLRAPREVASFAVPGQTPHNFWLDEGRGVLYLAWYGQGVRAVDVSGDLLGELNRQGREISGALYAGGAGSCDRSADVTCTWAPQVHGGLVWVSDMNRGLVVLEPPL